MRSDSHIIIGIIAWIIYTAIFNFITKIHGGPIIFGLFVAIIGSIIPDILEPAKDWRHRGGFHSIRTLNFFIKTFCISALIGFVSVIFESFLVFYIIACFSLGYITHLLADGTTKVGLPFR